MEHIIEKNCIEMVAEEGYVVTNYKEGDTRIEYARTIHVSEDVAASYYAMKESDARIKRIQLHEIERENRKNEINSRAERKHRNAEAE